MKELDNLFKELKLKVEIKNFKVENSFLIFDIKLCPGGTFKKLEKFKTEIALGLKALSDPLIYPITKDGIIRVEVMVSELQTVFFKDIINTNDFLNSKLVIPLALGKLRDGSPLVADITKMPHLLISGATGSGKSILLQTIINSLLVNNKIPIKLALIDLKRVEFSYYNDIKNLFLPVAKDIESSLKLLESLVKEMNKRFLMLENAGVRDINSYKKMPYIIVIIDELADLMIDEKKDAQNLICKLAQKARACGIHLIVSTQRPSVDIVTGVIKANFPSRISCKVSSSVDSRTILDKNGAESLIGNGDAIIDCPEYKFKRFKSSFITEKDILENTRNKKNWFKKIWNN